MPLSVSMFCIASIWKMYSLPDRRAGSPVQFSDGPRMAKSSPARFMSLAMATETFWFLSSKLPAQPTQYRYSWSKLSPGSTIVTSSSLEAQEARSLCDRPQGFDEFSIDR
jgi:hypothetical protein